jgi:uncharacterized membrane protein (DUF373 family)
MREPARAFVARSFSLVEDIACAGLRVLLALAAFSLLFAGNFVASLFAHNLTAEMVNLLDQILLVLLIVELLYTVQVSFREDGQWRSPSW